MRRIAFIAALLLADSVSAQTLYKCIARTGTSYQQAPCPAGARTGRTIETAPEPPPTSEELAERARKALQDRAESEHLSRMAGTDRMVAATRRSEARQAGATQGTRHHDRCDSAKTHRQRALDRAGLSRTFDLLSTLDAEVAAACGD
ncbi:MAG: DUF4124 domain-containing protein [Luteimonas sp.]